MRSQISANCVPPIVVIDFPPNCLTTTVIIAWRHMGEPCLIYVHSTMTHGELKTQKRIRTVRLKNKMEQFARTFLFGDKPPSGLGLQVLMSQRDQIGVDKSMGQISLLKEPISTISNYRETRLYYFRWSWIKPAERIGRVIGNTYYCRSNCLRTRHRKRKCKIRDSRHWLR